MTVSVVILSYRPNDLRDLLRCLRMQTLLPYEVILIDTSRGEPLCCLVEAELAGSGIRLVYHHRPDLGTARGRNLGIDNATGELTALLDDDMLVARDYLEVAADFFAQPAHAQVAGITLLGPYPGIVAPPATNDLSSRLRRTAKCLFLLDSRRSGAVLPTGFRSELPGCTQRVDWIQGGNSVWRTTVLRRFRFDETMERYPYVLSEDIALAVRIAKEYQLWSVLGSGSHHKRSPGSRLGARQYGESLVRNHRHVARLRAGTVRTPFAFYWGFVGLYLDGLATLLARPSRDRLDHLRGVLDGALSRDLPGASPDPGPAVAIGGERG